MSTYMGMLWAVVQPVVTIMVIWVVFSVGLKVKVAGGTSYIEWLLPGYIGWQYFSEGLSGMTQSIVERSYLVKQISIGVEKLPVVKIISALVVHLILLMVVTLIYAMWGQVGLGVVQLIYYVIAMTCLMYGIGLMTSAISVFTRDTIQVVVMGLQLGFWATPIFWEAGIMPTEYSWIVEVNPLAYLVEGYRQSLMGGEWFWEEPYQLARYWVVTLVVILIGRRVFWRLKPHFADVL